jgi:hypothetical protein
VGNPHTTSHDFKLSELPLPSNDFKSPELQLPSNDFTTPPVPPLLEPLPNGVLSIGPSLPPAVNLVPIIDNKPISNLITDVSELGPQFIIENIDKISDDIHTPLNRKTLFDIFIKQDEDKSLNKLQFENRRNDFILSLNSYKASIEQFKKVNDVKLLMKQNRIPLKDMFRKPKLNNIYANSKLTKSIL